LALVCVENIKKVKDIVRVQMTPETHRIVAVKSVLRQTLGAFVGKQFFPETNEKNRD
jgi:hypothetical protein